MLFPSPFLPWIDDEEGKTAATQRHCRHHFLSSLPPFHCEDEQQIRIGPLPFLAQRRDHRAATSGRWGLPSFPSSRPASSRPKTKSSSPIFSKVLSFLSTSFQIKT